MAIIYTYPVKSIPVNADKILISDSADNNKTKQITVESIKGLTAGVTQIIAGTNVTIDPVGGTGNVTINASGGGSLTVKNEGVDLTTSASSINFTGVGVTATTVGNDVTVNVPDAYVIEDIQLASAVSKGTALYISGPAHGSGRVTVDIADATDNTKMPVVGLALENYSSGQAKMIVTGVLDNVDTSNSNIPGGTLGKVVYVDNSGVDNNLTGTKPTGSDLIQNVGIITKDGANGSIQVACIGRTNDLPNLDQGSLFIGNASNQATTLGIGANNTVLTSNGATASWQVQSETPAAGSAGQVQYNDGSNGFTASAGLSYSTASSLNTLTIGAQGGVAGVAEIKGAGTTVGRLRLYCTDLIAPHYFELMGPEHSGAATYSVQVPNTSPGATEKILSVSTWTSGTSTAKLGWVDLPVDTNIAENNLTLNASRILDLSTYSLQVNGSNVLRLSNANADPAKIALRVDNNVKVAGQAYIDLDALGSAGTSRAIDWNDSNIQSMTLNGNLTISALNNGNPGGCYILVITQPAEQAYTISWPPTVDWHNNNTAPGTITGDRTDVYTFICRTTTSFLGTYAEDFII